MYQEAINDLLENVRRFRDEIIEIVKKVESYYTVLDEYKSVIACLENAEKESKFWSDNIERFVYFMPVNQPLYGLILSLLASLAAKDTYVRPTTDVADIVLELAEKMELKKIFPNFHIIVAEREKFIRQYAENADAIYFVGKYDNAKKLQKRIRPKTLFLFSGTGINPFVVSENANVELAVEKAVCAGIYNSGQDCGKPKVYIVHESKIDEFISGLIEKLENVICDDYSNNKTVVGPLLREASLQDTVCKLLKYREFIKYGGKVDVALKIVYPTILKVDINQNIIYQEFFSPVFTVTSYREEKELEDYFKNNCYYENAMYVSVFGTIAKDMIIDSRSIIKELNVLDIEQGNLPFGGYGKKANYIWNGSKQEAHPFLISEELYKYYIHKNDRGKFTMRKK